MAELDQRKEAVLAAVYKNQQRGERSASTNPLHSALSRYNVNNSELDDSRRKFDFDSAVAERIAQRTHELQKDDIEQGGTGNTVSGDQKFTEDRVTQFYKDKLEDLIGDIGGMSRDMLKTQLKRMKPLMESIVESDSSEKDFLMDQYAKSVVFLQDEYARKSNIMARTTNFMGDLAEQYLDVRSLYSGFVQNNPIMMGLFNVASSAIKRHRQNKQEREELLKNDAHRQEMAKRFELQKQKDADRNQQREEELQNIKREHGIEEEERAEVSPAQNSDVPSTIESLADANEDEPVIVRDESQKQDDTSVADKVQGLIAAKRDAKFERITAKKTETWQNDVVGLLESIDESVGKINISSKKDGGGILGGIMDMLGGTGGKIAGGIAGIAGTGWLGSKIFGSASSGASAAAQSVPAGAVPKSGATGGKIANATTAKAGGLGSKIVAKGAMKALGPIAALYEGYQEYDSGGSIGSAAVSAGGAGAGAMSGAAVGAMLGSAMVPVVGTVVGGILGGIGGAIVGEEAMSSMFGDSEKEKERNLLLREMEKAGVINIDDVIPGDDSELNKTMLPDLNVKQLQALLSMDDFDEEDTKAIQKELIKKKSKRDSLNDATSNITSKDLNNIAINSSGEAEVIDNTDDVNAKAIENMIDNDILDHDFFGDNELDIERTQLINLSLEQLVALKSKGARLDSEDVQSVQDAIDMKMGQFNADNSPAERMSKVAAASNGKLTTLGSDVATRNSEKGFGLSSVSGDVKGLLETISEGEGTGGQKGYDTEYAYGKYSDGTEKKLTDMTMGEVKAHQKKMLENQYSQGIKRGTGSSAVGKYQFISGTLNDVQEKMGISDDEMFTPDMQDRMGEYLLKTQGGLDAYQNSEKTKADQDKFTNQLSSTWASIAKANSTEGTYGDASKYGKQHVATTNEEINNAISRFDVSNSETMVAKNNVATVTPATTDRALALSNIEVPVQNDAAQRVDYIETMSDKIAKDKEEQQAARSSKDISAPSTKVVTNSSPGGTPSESVDVKTARNSESSIQRVTDRYVSHGLA